MQRRLVAIITAIAVFVHLWIVIDGQTSMCNARPQIPDSSRKLQAYTALQHVLYNI